MTTRSKDGTGRRRGRRSSNLTLKIELLDGSKIIDSLDLDEIESQDEANEILGAIEAALEPFGFEFDDDDNDQ